MSFPMQSVVKHAISLEPWAQAGFMMGFEFWGFNHVTHDGVMV
jgi:hypothetical protein